VDAAVTETNAIKLIFLTHDGQIKEITDNDYRPYFLALNPLTTEENEAVRLFSGNVQTVEKPDVFTGQTRVLSKIMWPNARIASKAVEQFRQVWEAEIDLPKSYVYDKGFHFGAWHSENDLKPILTLSEENAKRLETTFREARTNDQTKYEQLLWWFTILNQPMPNIDSQVFGVKDADAEQIHAAWVLARIGNIPLSEAFRSHHVSDWLKSIIHTYLRKNNILIPTSEELKRGQETHTVTGALTVAPKAGIYFNTVVCDFESLYPLTALIFHMRQSTAIILSASRIRFQILMDTFALVEEVSMRFL
jgi:DNA polymerase elongation subunit (family B)